MLDKVEGLRNTIISLDRKTEKSVEKLHSKLGIIILDSITSLGSVAFNLILVFFLYRTGQDSWIYLITALATCWAVIYPIKRLMGRERPKNHVDMVFERDSFPSGHSGTAFTTAVLLSSFYQMRAAFFTLAIMVAFSRIYLEDHFLSDVVTGSIIGIAVGMLVLNL